MTSLQILAVMAALAGFFYLWVRRSYLRQAKTRRAAGENFSTFRDSAPTGADTDILEVVYQFFSNWPPFHTPVRSSDTR